MALLTKAQILDADDRPTVDVEIPEWGGTVRIAMMSGWARDRYDSRMIALDGKTSHRDNLRASFLSYCIVGEDGELMFTDEDILALGRKSISSLNKLFEAASNLNAVGVEGLEDAAGN